MAHVALSEIRGLPAELVAVLQQAGKNTLQDILDLEREEVLAMPGISAELADKLMAFLNEMTEDGEEEQPAKSEPPAPPA